MGAYAASKHAVEALSGSLRIELMLYGIDVVVIGPDDVESGLVQWKNMNTGEQKPCSIEDVIAAILDQ